MKLKFYISTLWKDKTVLRIYLSLFLSSQRLNNIGKFINDSKDPLNDQLYLKFTSLKKI
jgi:hypothetical protein